MKLRPLSGSSRTCSPVTRPEISAPTVFTPTALASTLTVSVELTGRELDVDRAHVGHAEADLRPDRGLEAGGTSTSTR